MDEVVDLLTKRMESNPEEFCEDWDPESDNTLHAGDYRAPKWQRVIYQLRSRMGDDNASMVPSYHTKPLPFLSDEQTERLYAKYVEIQGNEFERYEAGVALTTAQHPVNQLRATSASIDMSPIKWGNP